MGNRIRTRAATVNGIKRMGITGHDGEQRRKNAALRAIQAAAGQDLLVYAVRTTDGLIKIGATKDIASRIRHIDGGVAEILALRAGSRSDELEIHRSLSGHAAQGREYYLPTPSVLRVVNEMRAGIGLDPLVFKRTL